MGGYTSKCEKKSKSLHPTIHPAEICGIPGSEGDVLHSLQIGDILTQYSQLRSVGTLALKLMQVWDMMFCKACR
jgi:hypothetical protein